MNRLNPYHLIALLGLSLSLLVFFKINKHSFYHHYFKVIEEVEVRNSQEFDLPVYDDYKVQPQVQAWISQIVRLIPVSFSQPFFLKQDYVYLPEVSIRLYSLSFLINIKHLVSGALYVRNYPCRAP